MITIPDNVLIIMNRCLLVLSQFVRQSDKLDYRSVAEKISQSAVEGLSISRVSVWQLNPSLVSMECIALFVNDALVTGAQLPTLHEKDFPIYFKALQEERFVVANDARNDSDTCEFTESYLKPLNIFSMLDLPIRQDGKVVGILCCEQTDSIREWDLLSQNYAGMLADIAERALAEVAIKRLALFDPLTLLANRPKLLKDIRETEPTALIIFDITSFASINDGHL